MLGTRGSVERRFLPLCLLFTLLVFGSVYVTAASRPAKPDDVRLVLPPVIYAVPGIESNLYFDNVVLLLNRKDYAFDVICVKGIQLEERWSFVPDAEDVGEYPIEVVVRDERNAVLARGRSLVKVAPKENGRGALTTLLLVGASLTEYSYYPQQLLDLDQADGYLALKLIGSRGPTPGPPVGQLRHEGYSGWTAEAFVTLHGPLSRSGYYVRPVTGSPFLYETTPGRAELDFARYCKEFNNGKGPDAITVLLIANDIFTATDENIDSRIGKMIGYFDALVSEFHRVRPDTRIGLELTVPPSRSQDGFRNYTGAGRQSRWQYRRNIHRAWERMIEHYRGREAEHVYLVPEYVNFDTERNYPTWKAKAHARATQEAERIYNGTHPSPEGYRQIADALYCWLKAVIPAPAEHK